MSYKPQFLALEFQADVSFTPQSAPKIAFPHLCSIATAVGPFGTVLAFDGFAEKDDPPGNLVGTRGSYAATITQQGRTDHYEGVGQILAVIRKAGIGDVTSVLTVFGPKSEATEGIVASIVGAWMAKMFLPRISGSTISSDDWKDLMNAVKRLEAMGRPQNNRLDMDAIRETAMRIQNRD